MKGLYFLLLSLIGLNLSCSSLKQKFSKKESQTLSLYRQEALKAQTLLMEIQERELMNYFGETATLLLKDGFRFHPDSGLIGTSAVFQYRTEAMVTESQRDSSLLESQSEKYQIEKVQLKTKEVESRKSKVISYWWLLLLLPVLWWIGKQGIKYKGYF